MAVSPQLQAYLATLKISPDSCKGFEMEALGACMGVVHYLSMKDDQRLAWLTAIQTASFNSAGTLTAGPDNKSFFYIAVLHRKNAAYGMAIKPWKADFIDPVEYPWALPEEVFRKLDAEVIQGKGLAAGKQTQWSDVVQAGADMVKSKGGATPIAGLGIFALKRLITRYAPRLAAVVFSEWTVPVLLALGFTAVTLQNMAVRVRNADAKQNFAVDRRRRDLDKTMGVAPAEAING